MLKLNKKLLILTFLIIILLLPLKSNISKPILLLVKDGKFTKAVKKRYDNFEDYLESELGPNYKAIIDKNWASVELANIIEEEISLTDFNEIKYPNYFGGMYINDNNDLVIQIVNSNIPKVNSKDYKQYKKLTTAYDNVIYENVEYSYSKLETIQKKIQDYYKENYSFETTAYYNFKEVKETSYTLDDMVSGFGIDEKSNRVIIYLYNNNEATRNKFKKTILDSPTVIFKQGGLNQLD